MARSVPYRFVTLRFFLRAATAAAFVCAAPATFAQHGGGGAGHFGGGGHVSSPHVSPPVSVPHMAAPPTIVHVPTVRMAGPPAAGAGTRNFVTVPPRVHILPPPGGPRPILGNRLIPPPSSPGGAGPHMTIGFPPSSTQGRVFVPGQALSFSGEGHEIHQNASASDVRVAPADRDRIHIHPRSPVPIFPGRPGFPGVGRPFFGFGPFGGPFFGGPFIGFGLGFNGWGPTCGPFWGWGFGCNALPLYDYGIGGYGAGGYYGDFNSAPSENLEAQPENPANEPYIYEYPPAPVTGGGERELVELYLKDGSVYRVTDYWVVNDELHFTTLDATGTTQTEQVVAFGELDLQKTVDVNSAHGFRFVLRNQPVQEYLEQQNGAETPAAPPQPPIPPQPRVPQNPQ